MKTIKRRKAKRYIKRSYEKSSQAKRPGRSWIEMREGENRVLLANPFSENKQVLFVKFIIYDS